jgi:haloalkane dehalogenase
MLHGNPTWSFFYRDLIRKLSSSWRCIVPDHIGMGLSDKPPIGAYPYALQQRVLDVSALLDRLEIERVHLIVHDWGGMIGVAWAVQNPQRVASLTIFNTAAFKPPLGYALPAAIRWARAPGIGALLVRGANGFSRGAIHTCTVKAMPQDVVSGYLYPYQSWGDRVGVHAFVLDIPMRPSDPAYAILDATEAGLAALVGKPVMLAWGEKDFVFDSRFLAQWTERFPQAEVHRFSDAGHYLLEDAGDRIIPIVDRFLLRTLGADSRVTR